MTGKRQSRRPDVGAMRVMAEAGHELIPLHRWDAVRTEPDGTERRLGKIPSRSAWTSSPDETERALAEAEAEGINLGVRLDDETLVVDVDPRNFADGVDSLQRLSEAVGVDLYNWTPRTETGGGGLHLWMRKPPDLRLRAGLSAEYPGIDFKTRGGQVVAPGSIHPDTGRQYVLDDFLGEIGDPEPVPDELCMILRRDRQAVTSVRDEDRVMLEPEEVAELLNATGEVPDYEDWIKVLMACHVVSGGMAMVECQEWSWPDASQAVEDKWAGFDARGNDNGRVGWGTLRHLAVKHGGERARAVCDRLERTKPSDDFADELDVGELPEGATGESAATSELKEWVFVAESMSFVRRKDCQKFRPEAFNAMLAHHKPDANLLTSVYKNKTPVRKFERLVYIPGRPEVLDGGRRYNVWRPSGVEAKPGDLSVFDEHMELMLPDQRERDMLLDFLHFVVCKPQVKIMFATLLYGEQGTGKTAIGTLAKRAIGRENVSEPSNEEVNSKWTAWQEGASLAIIEELMTNGRMEMANRLKTVITNDTLRIEGKNQPLYSIPNHMNLMGFTNHKNAVRLEQGDRRWMILFSVMKPQGEAYYRRLYDFIGKRESAEAFKHMLGERTPTLNPKGRAPDTAGKDYVTEASQTDVEAVVWEWAASRTGPLQHDLFRFERVWDAVPRHCSRATKSAVTAALEGAGAVKHTRDKNGSVPGVILWSMADHDRWQAAGPKGRFEAFMAMRGIEGASEFMASEDLY
ncbi:MAG: bifunctional DNA primase/polymerase [Paracoccaceae bacterium]